ncbi:MAG: hypothetical protein KatS3mg031_0262 [Chitinophagales bacterium]|nr:MAG: hypothetical protein KatS3mg031_0262 [Chitinophagales bacterium]
MLWSVRGWGQIESQGLEQLHAYEQKLSKLGYAIVNDSTQEQRAQACFQFIPTLVEALKVPGSFYYPFDSLKTISILMPPDRSFRIFSWQLRWGNGLFRHFGAIQMRADSLVLFPLYDMSDSLQANPDTVVGAQYWYGALYYNIYPFRHKRKNYYVLFGYDQNDLWSSKKLLDVLTFDENGQPVFGAPVFEVKDSSGKKKLINRFLIEYRKDAAVSLNYSADDKMIVFDHLVAPEERLADLKFTFIPDGTYEGFRLKRGRWVYVEKIKTININKPDSPPVPVPKSQK